jgi:hypothetical protein
MSILEKLDTVFEVREQPNGDFLFEEQCDKHFCVVLTPDEVRQLIKELEALLT